MPDPRRLFGLWALVAIAALIAAMTLGRYGWNVVAFGLLYAGLATSWTWIRATGLFSLGQAAFFGTGALTEAWLVTVPGLPPWLALPLAAVSGGAAALPLIPALRLPPPAFALATLAYAVLLKGLAGNIPALGPQGFLLPDFPGLSGPDPLLVGLLGILAAGLGIGYSVFLARPGGRAAAAIRQAPQTAEACGIGLVSTRSLPFVGTAAATAICGALYGHIVGSVEPIVVFAPIISALPLVLGMVGGALNPLGGLAGMLALYPLDELVLRPLLPQAHVLVYGVALVSLLMLRPAGLLPARVPVVPTGAARAPRRAIGLSSEHLAVRRNGSTVLEEVSLDVASGQILRVTGPNGAGKSSLLLALAGALPAHRGFVRFGGRTVPQSVAGRARIGVARTFQAPQPFPEWTVRDNVAIAAERAGASAEVDRILEDLQLVTLGNRRAGELSVGEGKRLELARALALNPAILLLDEPLAGLSPDSALRVAALIAHVRDGGTLVIWVEHRFAPGEMADQVLGLEDGRVTFYGRPVDWKAVRRSVPA